MRLVFSASNRKLPYGLKFRFFVVDTVVDEETQSVYMNKSISSQVYVVDQREGMPVLIDVILTVCTLLQRNQHS